MIYSTYRKTKTLEPSNVGIESRKAHILPSPPPKIEFIQSYASLKREVRRYKQYTMILLMICVFTTLLAIFAYSSAIDMHDTYIMHNYTNHMNHVENVVKREGR